MTATISGSAVSTLVALTTTGNTILGDASTDTLNVGNGDLVKDASGNVGIGTSSPTGKMTIEGGVSAGGILSALTLRNSLDGGVGLYFDNVVSNNLASIEARVTSTGAGTDDGILVFSTAIGGTNTEQARIDSSGNLLVGTTTTNGKFCVTANSSTQTPIYFNDTATAAAAQFLQYFLRNNVLVGSIQTTSTATLYVSSSDYRLKNTIAPMTGALDKVALLKPVTYKWKVDGSGGEGFIAHELAEVCPHAVTGEKDAVETYTDEDGNEQTRPAYQGVDTSFLVATLTAAIQELNAKFEEYKAAHP
jgi:hypothetical protein